MTGGSSGRGGDTYGGYRLRLVEQLRLIKDADEISQIRASVLLAASLFQTALSVIKPGVAETQVAGELELQARRAGAEKMSFDTIVAAGPRSALPHGRASAQPIPAQGFIILDYGVILASYCSDMTRTVHAGAVSRSHRRMYEAVREAQWYSSALRASSPRCASSVAAISAPDARVSASEAPSIPSPSRNAVSRSLDSAAGT